jgi:hypothetical protein
MYRLIGGDQKEYGPVSADEVRLWITQRRLQASSLVQAEGTTDWKPLSLFPEFSSTLASVAPAAAIPAPAVPQTGNNNGMAVIGLICGIMAWPATCCCYGFPFNVLGIIFSVIALAQLRHAHGAQGVATVIAQAGAFHRAGRDAHRPYCVRRGCVSWSDLVRQFKH